MSNARIEDFLKVTKLLPLHGQRYGPGYSLTEMIRCFVQYNIEITVDDIRYGEASRRAGRTIQLRSRQEFA